ncbi:DUF2892 domain-containing protein [Reinekea sp. G2M2-21]|uniref:YgaP family membrane protein n=1 Tax=Reinekea sp. G2M2-21 TaxID=2788942 RepID=UPI0018A936D7|nr:DUF2892 domain-containing protein [Reinekea sp. G2M2-21]MDX1342371.1 DUF2892 domain-containing protein [Reinekea sp.]MDX1473570.1 DUF2892 domain-containing protein [Reinekea sp.]
MKVNMGNVDRIVRLILAAIMILAVVLQWVSGAIAIIVALLAAVFVITATVKFCPLYLPFGLSTNKSE